MLCVVVKSCAARLAMLKTALRAPSLNLGSLFIYRCWSKCGPNMSKCKITWFSGQSEPKTIITHNTTNPKPTPSTDIKDGKRGVIQQPFRDGNLNEINETRREAKKYTTPHPNPQSSILKITKNNISAQPEPFFSFPPPQPSLSSWEPITQLRHGQGTGRRTSEIRVSWPLPWAYSQGVLPRPLCSAKATVVAFEARDLDPTRPTRSVLRSPGAPSRACPGRRRRRHRQPAAAPPRSVRAWTRSGEASDLRARRGGRTEKSLFERSHEGISGEARTSSWITDLLCFWGGF